MLSPGSENLSRFLETFSADQRSTMASYAVMLPASPERSRNSAGWTEPYRNSSSDRATVITYAVPFTDAGGTPGVADATLRLDFLSTIVRDVPLGPSGFALVVSRRRMLIAHSRRDLNDDIHDPLAELTPELRALVEPVLNRSEAGESAFTAMPIGGRDVPAHGPAGWRDRMVGRDGVRGG